MTALLTIILIGTNVEVWAQKKDHFRVDFNRRNSAYDKNDARRDFGDVSVWTSPENTAIHNNALRIRFPKGKFGASCGMAAGINLAKANRRSIEYRVKWESGFDFRKGGKLPGLGGGTHPGGCVAADGSGFTSRSSWTTGDLFNLYVYYTDKKGNCGDNWTTNFVFKANRWYTIRLEVKANSGRNRDGYAKMWVDGKQVFQRSSVKWMTKNNAVDYLSMSMFMGGSNASFSPNHTQYLWVDYVDVKNLDRSGAPSLAGTYNFKNKATGRFLDAQSGGALRTTTASGGTDKKWRLVRSSGNYYNIDGKATSLGCLDTDPGGRVKWITTEPVSTSIGTQWFVESLGNNIYRFKNRNSDRGYLAENPSTHEIMYSSSRDAQTKWELINLEASRLESNNVTVGNSAFESLVIAPNPATSTVTIWLNGEGQVSVSIYTINGKAVYQNEHVVKNLTLPVKAFPDRGMYFVAVKSNTKQEVRKLLIQ